MHYGTLSSKDICLKNAFLFLNHDLKTFEHFMMIPMDTIQDILNLQIFITYEDNIYSIERSFPMEDAILDRM